MQKTRSNTAVWLCVFAFVSAVAVIPPHLAYAEASSEIEQAEDLSENETEAVEEESVPSDEEDAVFDENDEPSEQIEGSDAEYGWE